MKSCFLLATLSAALMVPLSGAAQNFSIDWFSIDGGGGTSSGGVYSLSGSIGQPDTGTSSGGAYTVIGGYWAIIAAIQIPDGPELKITQSLGMVTVSWPLSATDYVLQEKSDLTMGPATWMEVPPASYGNNGTERFITVSVPLGGTRFYQLSKP